MVIPHFALRKQPVLLKSVEAVELELAEFDAGASVELFSEAAHPEKIIAPAKMAAVIFEKCFMMIAPFILI